MHAYIHTYIFSGSPPFLIRKYARIHDGSSILEHVLHHILDPLFRGPPPFDSQTWNMMRQMSDDASWMLRILNAPWYECWMLHHMLQPILHVFLRCPPFRFINTIKYINMPTNKDTYKHTIHINLHTDMGAYMCAHIHTYIHATQAYTRTQRHKCTHAHTLTHTHFHLECILIVLDA